MEPNGRDTGGGEMPEIRLRALAELERMGDDESALQRERIDTARLIGETKEAVRGAAVEFAAAQDLPRIEAGAQRIQRLLVHCIALTAEAARGAPVEVRLSRAGADHWRIKISADAAPDPEPSANPARGYPNYVRALVRRLAERLGGSLASPGDEVALVFTLPARAAGA